MIRNIWPPSPHESLEDLSEERRRLVLETDRVFEALRERGDIAWFLQEKLRHWVCSPWQDGGEGSGESVREFPKGGRRSRVLAKVWRVEGSFSRPTIWEWEVFNPEGEPVASGMSMTWEEAEAEVDADLRGRGYILP
jgi:hypothetical protein